jgi:hypothetical protein
LSPQYPDRHWPVQHSASAAHGDPIRVQAGPPSPHRAGDPVHARLQQSASDEHAAPLARHGAVHTEVRPVVTQLPRQQSASALQSDPGARHGPGPRSHRFGRTEQTPLQQLPATSQPSPVPWQGVPGAGAQSRSVPSQNPEQQSAVPAQTSPRRRQSAPPQTPALQAIEQQSSALAHGAPSAAQ